MLDPLGGKDVKKGVNLLRPLGITVLFGEHYIDRQHTYLVTRWFVCSGFANVVTESKNYFNLAKQVLGDN